MTPPDEPPDGDAGGPSANAVSILVVEDNSDSLTMLCGLLKQHGHAADGVLGGAAAIEALVAKDYDVMFLDLIMPEVDGHDVLEFAAQRSLETRTIVVSGDGGFSGVRNALRCGAFDYLQKPYEPGDLLSTLERAIRQCTLERENRWMAARLEESEKFHRFIVDSSPDIVYMTDPQGCFTYVNQRAESLLGYSRDELIGRSYRTLVHDDDLEAAHGVFNERRADGRASKSVEMRLHVQRPGADDPSSQSLWTEVTTVGVYSDHPGTQEENYVGTYGIIRDINDRKNAEELIHFQAHHDLLTRLPNRVLLLDRLTLAITQARRSHDRLAFVFLDLDRFKWINDSLGHAVGDLLLRAVSDRLSGCLRRGDTLARFGGDEFAIVLPQVATKEDVEAKARQILHCMATPFSIKGREFTVGASIGIAMYPDAGESGDELIQNADIAMYQAKNRGGMGYEFFSREMNRRFSERFSLEQEMRYCISRDELRVHYQPLVSLSDGEIVGVEALVRWNHPVRGMLRPEEFLPLAEETGFIALIDQRVRRQAFADVAYWRDQGLGEVALSMNLSSAHLAHGSSVDRFFMDLEGASLDPAKITIEITENSLMREDASVVKALTALREMGVLIAIDDFGIGYSSFAHLQHIPIQVLKIDRSFIVEIEQGAGEATIVDAIVAMARGLHLNTVAEGIENVFQLRYLREHGIEVGQGNFLCEAVPAKDIERLLRASTGEGGVHTATQFHEAQARTTPLAPADADRDTHA